MRTIIVQKKNKMSHVIYYDSRTFIHAQKNYTTTEKELLAIALVLSKFYPCLLCSQMVKTPVVQERDQA